MEAGFDFEIGAPKIAERFDVDLTLRELTVFNAMRKGMAAARLRPKNIGLAADTLVSIDGQVLGKPADKSEAVAMLRRLSGRAHEVCTSVFICHPVEAKSIGFYEISRVHFHKLSRDKIDNYLARVNPLDKAGAYAAQGIGAVFIDSIHGSYTNVVGLPLALLFQMLRRAGVDPMKRGSGE